MRAILIVRLFVIYAKANRNITPKKTTIRKGKNDIQNRNKAGILTL
jgi:hypothetical protein